MVITSIDAVSAGKIMGVVYAFFGLIFGGLFTVVSLAGMAVGGRAGPGSVIFGVGAVILLPLLYGIMGFIGGALGAFVYNAAANVIGGVHLGVDYQNLPYVEGSREPSDTPWE